VLTTGSALRTSIAAREVSRLPRVMVVGDSTSATAAPGFSAVARGAYELISAGMPPKNGSYCALDIWVDSIVEGDHQRPRPPAPECNWLQTFPTLVKVFDPSVVVLMFSLWDTQAHHVNGRWLESGSPEWNAEMMAAAHCAISELSANGARIEIVLAPDTVQQPGPGANHLNAVYQSLAAEDPARIGIVDARVTIRNGGTGYRWDGIHYTPDGAGVLAEIARPAIVSGLALPRLLPVPPAACQPAP